MNTETLSDEALIPVGNSTDVPELGRLVATEKVTAYFTPEQYDKIEELQRAHRKQTNKRISVNELLRRPVTNADIEDILPRP